MDANSFRPRCAFGSRASLAALEKCETPITAASWASFRSALKMPSCNVDIGRNSRASVLFATMQCLSTARGPDLGDVARISALLGLGVAFADVSPDWAETPRAHTGFHVPLLSLRPLLVQAPLRVDLILTVGTQALLFVSSCYSFPLLFTAGLAFVIGVGLFLILFSSSITTSSSATAGSETSWHIGVA